MRDARVRSPYPSIRSHPRDDDRSFRSRRSLSPPYESQSHRVVRNPRRSNSIERRDYESRDYARHHEDDREGSRIPSMTQSKDYDDVFLHSDEYRQKFAMSGRSTLHSHVNSSLHQYGGSTYSREHDFGSSSSSFDKGTVSNSSLHQYGGSTLSREKDFGSSSSALDKSNVSASYRFSPSRNTDDIRGMPSSRNLNVSILKQEDLHSNKIPSQGSYKEEEIQIFYPRDVSYPTTMTSSQSKSFNTTSYASLKEDSFGSYRDSLTFPSLGGTGRSNGKFKESLGDKQYVPAASGGTASELTDLPSYRPSSFSFSRLENGGYSYGEHGDGRGKDDSAYLSDGLYEKMKQSSQGYANKDLLRPRYMDPDVDRVYDKRNFHGGQVESGLRDHHSFREPISSYLSMNSTLETPRGVDSVTTGSNYLEFGSRVSKDHEISPPDGDYRFGRQAEISPPRGDHQFVRQAEISPPRGDHQFGRQAKISPPRGNHRFGRQAEVSPLRGDYRFERQAGISPPGGDCRSGRQAKISPPGADYGFGKEAGPGSYKNRSSDLPRSGHDRYTHKDDKSLKRRLMAEEVDRNGRSERMHKRKYIADEGKSSHDPKSTLSGSDDIAIQVQEMLESAEKWSAENAGALSSCKISALARLQYKKYGRKSNDMGSRRDFASQGSSFHEQGRASKHHLSEVSRVSIKERLEPAPRNFVDSYGFERRDAIKPYKYGKGNYDGYYDNGKAHDYYGSEERLLPVKHEPPEGSEEFSQLVHKAFLRFSKQLNENQDQRKRLKEEGGGGSLLCSVCGSHSKEFMDTRRLVEHTFMCAKVGIRADHLGLHKAICVLMGWNSCAVSGNSWVRQSLSDAEALALKEDLVIWPPILVIHNSSIRNKNPDERKAATVEGMEALLAGMGFSMKKIKVCLGKPANEIMVVKFLPMLPGLQEAERLHQYYIENKRGRQEFLHINSKNVDRSKEIKGQNDKVDHLLYGYLGIAEDLDKLDYETKKRCVVKSKKEMHAIADATLQTDQDSVTQS